MDREYWRARALVLFQAMEQEAQSYRKTAEQAYELALVRIRRDLADWYQRFADNNSVSMAEARRLLNASELRELQWTVEEYIEAGRSLDPKWLKQLENASARVHISRLEAIQLQIQQQIELLFANQLDDLDGLLRRVYAGQYYHTIFEMQRAFHLGWQIAALTERQLAMALAKPWTTDNLTFSERVWKNRTALVNTLQTELSQALIRGDPLKRVTDAMARRMQTSKRAAGRLVMTESAYLSAQGQLTAYRELGVDQVEIVETLDVHTCAVCQGLDGTILPLTAYDPGVTVPPFHPWCRGCTAPYFADHTGGERAARNQDGQTYYVSADMTYETWRETFVSLPLSDLPDTIEAENGLIIRAKSGHALERAMQRGVESAWVQDALQSPLHIRAVQWDDHNRPSQRFIGKDATVNVNPETSTIVTVWRTGSATRKKYGKGGQS